MTSTVTAPARPATAPSGRPAKQNQANPASRGQWRLPVVIAAIILLGGGLIAWLQPGAAPTGYLDPGNPGANGAGALATILTGRGERITTATTATAASKAAAPSNSAGTNGTTTILVTNPYLLSSAELNTIAHTSADLVLPDPDSAELAVLAPQVTVAEHATTGTANPDCTLPAATLAGNADMGGTLLDTTARDAERCYRADGRPSLVRYSAGGRVITVLGTGTSLTNAQLGNLGNAALALNLLDTGRLIWLEPTATPPGPPPTGTDTFTSLIPKPVYMVTVQLLIAVLLLALWRVRRLGPIVPERLPAVVRASETTEGHGRLYHARRARDRAAQVLRDAAGDRVRKALSLPPDAGPELTAATLAQRTGAPVTDIADTLSGPLPADDAALVALADRLDELERKAGAR